MSAEGGSLSEGALLCLFVSAHHQYQCSIQIHRRARRYRQKLPREYASAEDALRKDQRHVEDYVSSRSISVVRIQLNPLKTNRTPNTSTLQPSIRQGR